LEIRIFNTIPELLESLEDYELGLLVKERAVEKPKAVEVSIDDL
jgi:hypothetical protein